MKAIKVQDAEGNSIDVEIKDYKKAVFKEFDVKDYKHSEHGDTPAKNIVDHIVDSLVKDKEVDNEIKEAFSELYERVSKDVSFTKENSKSKAEKAQEEKEAKEKAKAEEEAKKAEEAKKLQARQGLLVSGVAAGVELANSEFVDELKTLSENLPEGVKVEQKGNGYGLVFPADATEETIGATFGYLNQKAQNSAFIGNQLHFWIGDTVNRTTELKIFPTAKEASEKISKLLEENHGKKIVPIQIAEYGRMASRTPLELRNPKADISAYNAIAKVKGLSKGEKETEDAFKARVVKFEKDRAQLQEKLSKGEVTSRKEILPLVQELEYQHGLKERPDPSKETITIGQYLNIFAHTTFALENLVGTHEDHPEAAVYKHGEDLIVVPKSELEEKRDEAFANISNAFYTSKKNGLNPKDYARGFVEKDAEVTIGKDGDGKPIKETQKTKVPVYPAPFWPIEEAKKEEAPAA